MRKLKEALGIVGWIDSKDLRERDRKKRSNMIMWSDPIEKLVKIKVAESTIEEIRIGAEKEGMTFVQLIIQDEEEVSVVAQVKAPKGFTPFADPVLANLTARAAISVIMI